MMYEKRFCSYSCRERNLEKNSTAGATLAAFCLAFAILAFVRVAEAGSNTYIAAEYDGISYQEFRCRYFSSLSWWERGRCDGGTPKPWDAVTVRGPGADDDIERSADSPDPDVEDDDGGDQGEVCY